MKLFLLTIVAVTTIAITSYAQNFTPLALGSSVPMSDVKMKDISGREVSLKDVNSKNGLLVMFSCNTCPYVIKNQTRTNEIAAFAKQNGIGVILINSNEDMRDGDDSYESMVKYARNQKYNWSYVVDTDSKIANAFGATRTPETFLFDKSGKLVYHGAIDDNPANASAVTREHLKEAINEMTAGKEITVQKSRSVGCTIKRIQ